MWKLFTKRQKTGAIVGVIILFTGFVCAIWSGLYIGKESDTVLYTSALLVTAFGSAQVASWIQAIGVIGAMFWAVLIFNEEKREKYEAIQTIERSFMLFTQSEVQTLGFQVEVLLQCFENDDPADIGIDIPDIPLIKAAYKNRELYKSRQLINLIAAITQKHKMVNSWLPAYKTYQNEKDSALFKFISSHLIWDLKSLGEAIKNIEKFTHSQTPNI